MSEIVVVATLVAEPGQAEKAEQALRSLIEPTHAEAGCLAYALHRGADDPQRFVLVERWASREDLDAHKVADHMEASRAAAGELFGTNIDIVVYEPLAVGDPGKGSLAGAA
jgi:quinol monooxygenase YgiN